MILPLLLVNTLINTLIEHSTTLLMQSISSSRLTVNDYSVYIVIKVTFISMDILDMYNICNKRLCTSLESFYFAF